MTHTSLHGSPRCGASLLMKQFVLLAVSTLLISACSPDAVIETEPTPTAPIVKTSLTFMAPDGSYDALDSPVAPYVLAYGAGPSRLSPDGRTIATRLGLTGTRQLYVMDATADDPQATLTQISQGSGITFFEFSPTGALIYGADNNGDERENYWLIEPVEDGWSEPRLLLPATDQGFRQFGDFTGDGQTIVYASTERNGLDYDIYTADVETGETRRVFEGQFGNYVQAVAPDGSTAIISEAVGEDSDKLFVLDLETGERTLLSDPTPRANHTDAGIEYITPRFMPEFENNYIQYASNKFGEYVVPVESGIRPVNNVSTGIKWEEEASSDIDQLRQCGETQIRVFNDQGFSSIFLKGPSASVFLEDIPQGVHAIDCNENLLLVRASTPIIPGDLYLVDINTAQTRRVFTSHYDGLDPESLIQPQSVRIPARDGVELQGLLYLPPPVPTIDIEPKPEPPLPPVLFMVHGGPTSQSRPNWNGTVQYLLSRGVAVFQPNVRGSTGFGRTYVTLDDQRKRLDSVRDLVDMLDWLETDGRVDTSRAAVQGGSYGGYMVNAVLADYPDAFDAGIALFGVGDWVTALEVASPALKASDRIEYGDISDPQWREFYTEISPIAKADQIRVPVLYSHGAMDPRIDLHETEVMVRALRNNGIRADYVRFPDEGHGWRKLSNRLYYARVQADFIEDVLGE